MKLKRIESKMAVILICFDDNGTNKASYPSFCKVLPGHGKIKNYI